MNCPDDATFDEPFARVPMADAVKKGGDYILSGQKWFITSAHMADYIVVVAKTDTQAMPVHNGFSLFLVDAKAKGVSMLPIRTMGTLGTGEPIGDIIDGVTMQGLIARLSATPGAIRHAGRPLGADQAILGTDDPWAAADPPSHPPGSAAT